jgi:hypothetical protein
VVCSDELLEVVGLEGGDVEELGPVGASREWRTWFPAVSPQPSSLVSVDVTLKGSGKKGLASLMSVTSLRSAAFSARREAISLRIVSNSASIFDSSFVW